ncbi:ATP-binding protein [Roseateles amylovorans]|uniref:histidine kinase n=1 Tax=Roseateles amylovorans TaxID=2978473 RepID=A0ABY6B6U0_9BURK|nr:ATP-binding protein [Roseateles amylovorans]
MRQALQRARYSEHLAALGKLVVDSGDPQDVLRQVPAIVAQAVEVDQAVVYLLAPGKATVTVAGGFGVVATESIGTTLPNLPDTPAGFVLAQSGPVIVTDYREERRFDVPPSYLASGLRSALSVPLSDRGQVVGALAARSSTPQRFGDPELRFLESVANLLGTCLQRAQTEEALRHSQQLEAVGQLTGGIAHDFNNLLTVIQGNLQVMADLPAVAGDAVAPSMVAAATRASRRGAELTSKLLAFSRRQVLQPSSIDVCELLHSLADMLRRTLDQRIRIRVEVADGCPDVMADASQLESALLNIAINARDAMPGGGDLVFAAQALGALKDLPPDLRESLLAGDRSAASGDVHYVRLTVRDTGTGMPDEVKERAFEPFFTTKQAGRGTGLGLSTVYGFARQSRGQLLIDSVVGQGTTISLVLPQPPVEMKSVSEVPSANGALAPGLRVMLVEDDAAVRAVARRFLTDLGCVVTACASAEEALRRLDEMTTAAAAMEAAAGTQPTGASAVPDCLISDVALGAGMRGTELAERIQLERPQMRILLMSGYSSELQEGEAPALPWDFLPKPYTRDQLSDALARVMSAA